METWRVWFSFAFLLVLQKGEGRNGCRTMNHPVGGNEREVERGQHMDENVRQAPHAATSDIRVCKHEHDDAECVCQSKDGYVCAHVLNRMT